MKTQELYLNKCVITSKETHQATGITLFIFIGDEKLEGTHSPLFPVWKLLSIYIKICGPAETHGLPQEHHSEGFEEESQ